MSHYSQFPESYYLLCLITTRQMPSVAECLVHKHWLGWWVCPSWNWDLNVNQWSQWWTYKLEAPFVEKYDSLLRSICKHICSRERMPVSRWAGKEAVPREESSSGKALVYVYLNVNERKKRTAQAQILQSCQGTDITELPRKKPCRKGHQVAGKIEKNKIIFQSCRKFISEERKKQRGRSSSPWWAPVLERGINVNNSHGFSKWVKSLRIETGPHDLFPLAPEPAFLEH